MPCLTFPELPVPTPLPDGITLELPVGAPLTDLPRLCCKLPNPAFLQDIPPIPGIGVILKSPALAAVNAILKKVRAYVHSRPLKCPIE